MNKFDIYVDSAANLPDDLKTERDIRVISYSFTVNGEVTGKAFPFPKRRKSFTTKCETEERQKLRLSASKRSSMR